MQTPTSRRTGQRSWGRLLGAGGTTVVAIAAVMSAAGAAGAASAPNLGATGSVAALNTSSMEVQNASTGQTTVNWTTSTQFSKSVTESVSSLNPGSCVTVTGTASKKSKTTIAARSISVTSPTSTGSCNSFGTRTAPGGAVRTGGGGGFEFRGGGGFPAGGTSGSRPSFPSGGAGAGNFRKQFASIDIASGKVTAVKGSTLTVSGTSLNPGSFAGRTKKSSSKTKKFTPPKTEKLTITTSDSTPVSATQSTTPSALAVGDCVSAFGPAASTGAVTATTVRITSTGGGSCSGGFPRGGGGFFGGPGGGGQVSGSSSA
jgi:hypothetical protein